jgi:putative flippase GtrA
MNTLRQLTRWLVGQESVRFGLVGGACALLFLLVAYGLRVLGWGQFPATLATYSVCFGVGYGAQRSIAFRTNRPHLVTLPRYALLQAGAGIAVSLLASWITEVYDLRPALASLYAAMLAGAASFFISANWVFRDRRLRD